MVHKWLENFAYRINLSIWTFFIAAVIVVLAAVVTISIQATRAASENPVKSLRYE